MKAATMARCRLSIQWLKVVFDHEPVFSKKDANHCGLQLADLVARPIGLKQLNPTHQNRAYEVLEKKFRRSPQDRIEGWGLKCFP